ncbi:MAG: hypothetical protein U0X73_16495 [Thermoanaerobaculia bacterium]
MTTAPVTNFFLVPAPLSVLALLGAAGLLALALASGAWAALSRRARLARRLLLGGVAVVLVYGAALVGVGLATPQRELPVGAEKFFCEIDCHLGYAIEAAAPVPADDRSPGADLWTVTVRTRFDPRTTAPWRPREAPLFPNPRRAWVADAAGNRYPRSTLAERDLPPAEGLRDWTSPLVPGESYRTRLAFVLPRGARPTRLLIEIPDWMERLLVGDEASPFAGRVWLRLPD